ncbi:MAG: GMC family oxidoreductase N-terminal domain-containing protein [bacterium]
MATRAYDVIVVGSGPGGATVAKELALKHKKVLILERGSNTPIKGTTLQAISMSAIPGQSLLITYKMLAIMRGITTGGSSVVFYATAFDPPFDMLRSYNISIEDEIKEAKAELPIKPLSDELMGPMSKRIMESAQALGYKWEKLPKYIYQDKCMPNCYKCNLGCPYSAKWSARMFAEQAVSHGAVLTTGALVTKVITEDHRAIGVEYKKDGVNNTAYAPIIIIAAGGIGTPVILRASGIKRAGYDFFIDPLITVIGFVNDIKGGKEVPMAAGIHFEDEGYMMTDMTVPNVLYMFFAGQVLRLHRLFSHSKALQIMIKIKDDLGGRLTDSGGVRKHLTNNDMKKINDGASRAEKILRHAGAYGIFRSWYVASHPGGTAKIGDIVDANLQTEYKGLYICDASVIPQSWGRPPSLTLIGLGKRLARHLIQAK